MAFTLHCGHFQPELETDFAFTLLQALSERADPLREQILVVTPTGVLRKRLLETMAQRSAGPMYGVQTVSIHALCFQLAGSALRHSARVITDPLFYASLIQKIAAGHELLSPHNVRICRAVYQTIRDLQDGSVSPALLADVLEAAEADPELRQRVNPAWLRPLAVVMEKLDEAMEAGEIMSLPDATRLAADAAGPFAREISALLVYGFYDSTELQFAVLENLLRAVSSTGASHAFFPFPAETNRVEHPFEYAQPFFDRMFSLSASLGGAVLHLRRGGDAAAAGWERSLFAQTQPEPAAKGRRSMQQLDLFQTTTDDSPTRPEPRIDIVSAAGEYDEAWAVAKRILKLVLEGSSFDQILIVTRSGGEDLAPLLQALRENRIPCSLDRASTLARSPFAKFATLVLQARETALSPPILMELLSSPFLPHAHETDFRKVSELMQNLIIRSWDDWDRLEPLLQEKAKLPQFYDFLEAEDAVSLDSLRSMTRRIQELQSSLMRIPERASLPAFASSLRQTLSALSDAEEGAGVLELLDRVAGYSELEEPDMSLAEFRDVFRMYLRETLCEAPEPGGPVVHVAGMMQARGIPADFVFLMGLNGDVFPRRAYEDPFLPDSVRRALRDVTGAGPAEKRVSSLLPLKEGTDEELLLFGLALRMAQQRLVLSFRRVDEAGKKAAVSPYLDELLRLLTGKASENNERVSAVPRRLTSKISGDVLPTLVECGALPGLCSPEEVLAQQGISPDYAARVRDFGALLNHTAPEASRKVDGVVEDAAALWKSSEPSITLSYSRMKNYLQCPFRFFAANVLKLEESPLDAGEEDHDLDARLKGRMAEEVVKIAIQNLKGGTLEIEQAVDRAATSVRRTYAPVLPPVLLDLYMERFRAGAIQVLKTLQRRGYDLAASETPQYEDMIQFELLPASEELPAIQLRGIPDLLLRGAEGLIGELKWGARNTGKTPGYAFISGEAQFSMYPELVRSHHGRALPFQYFRLDVFASHGDPEEMLRRVLSFPVPGSIQKDNAVRIFGMYVEFQDAFEFLERVRTAARDLRSGNFRIIKDPGLFYPPCKYCNFTQICRRSHTETLLRGKQAERT